MKIKKSEGIDRIDKSYHSFFLQWAPQDLKYVKKQQYEAAYLSLHLHFYFCPVQGFISSMWLE